MMEKANKELDVAVVVRLGFRNSIQFLFVVGFMLLAVISMIPRLMEAYADYPTWIGVPLIIGFLIFLWGFGQQITTYVVTYYNTRSVHGDIVVNVKNIHEKTKMTLRGNMFEVDS